MDILPESEQSNSILTGYQQVYLDCFLSIVHSLLGLSLS